MRRPHKRPVQRERAEIFSLQLSPRLNKRSRSPKPALEPDQAQPPQREVGCIAPEAPRAGKPCRTKKGLMLSWHNEDFARCIGRRRLFWRPHEPGPTLLHRPPAGGRRPRLARPHEHAAGGAAEAGREPTRRAARRRRAAPRRCPDACQPRRRGLRAGALQRAGARHRRPRAAPSVRARRRRRDRPPGLDRRAARRARRTAEPAQSALVCRRLRDRPAGSAGRRCDEPRLSHRDRAPGGAPPRGSPRAAARRRTRNHARSSRR